MADYKVWRGNAEIEVRRDNVVLSIGYDPDPQNPRDWDNVWTFVCWHDDYDLGDTHDYRSPRDFLEDFANAYAGLSYEQMEDMTDEELLDVIVGSGKVMIEPIFMYEHSAIAFSTSNAHYPFNDPWDAGQVGWAYTDKVNEYTKEQLEEILRIELKLYQQYANGECYYFSIKKVDEDGNTEEYIDSCYGFYPGDSMKDMIEDMKAHVEEQYADLFDKAAEEI